LSKCLKDGSIKKHDSFLAKYYEGVRLVSKRKSCWDEVETLVDEVVAAHRAQDPERLEPTGMDRRIYLVAGAALKPVGKPVDLAAIGFVAAAQTLEPFKLDIRQAAQLVADALTRLKDTPHSHRGGFLFAIRSDHERNEVSAGRGRGTHQQRQE
jgi:hypothetical protein